MTFQIPDPKDPPRKIVQGAPTIIIWDDLDQAEPDFEAVTKWLESLPPGTYPGPTKPVLGKLGK